ncbi:MAG: type II secretion system protein [Candidatus Berkelbacteria bacterium]
MKKLKGFTLVELLVVIAVIGILSAVVILNTNSAKVKAREANMKTTLDTVQNIGVLCADGTTVGNLDSADAYVAKSTGTTTTPAICNGASPAITDVWPVPESGYYYAVKSGSSADPTLKDWRIYASKVGTAGTYVSTDTPVIMCSASKCSTNAF